jgi:hypothetical protein
MSNDDPGSTEEATGRSSAPIGFASLESVSERGKDEVLRLLILLAPPPPLRSARLCRSQGAPRKIAADSGGLRPVAHAMWNRRPWWCAPHRAEGGTYLRGRVGRFRFAEIERPDSVHRKRTRSESKAIFSTIRRFENPQQAILAVANGREHYFTRAIADRESKCPLPLEHFPPRWWFSEALGLWARQCWRRPCYRTRTSKFS